MSVAIAQTAQQMRAAVAELTGPDAELMAGIDGRQRVAAWRQAVAGKDFTELRTPALFGIDADQGRHVGAGGDQIRMRQAEWGQARVKRLGQGGKTVVEFELFEAAGGAPFTVTLGDAPLVAFKDIGGGSQEFHVPISELRGKDTPLRLQSDSKAALAFIVRGAWKRELADAKGLAATSAAKGPDIYRVFTDARGEAVDLAAVKPGQVLRVALLADLPLGDLDSSEMNYLAVTDRLPAGFEPIQPDLWTVARAPEVTDAHPFADMLRYGGSDASFIELRDDRVQIYFDRVWGERVLATYLVRASTPGTFVLPPAAAEFMYVGDSLGYSSTGSVTVK